MSYKVLIVEEHNLPRQYFESIVNSSKNYTIAASFPSTKMAESYCSIHRVELALIDLSLSDGMQGLKLAAKLKRINPRVKVIVVTDLSDICLIEKAKKAGVDSFWYTETQNISLLEVMDKTMAGGRIWPEKAPTVRLGMATNDELTGREMDVLRCIAKGYSNSEVGDELGMSVNTVRFHISNLLSKTGFCTRTELAIVVVRNGAVAVEF